MKRLVLLATLGIIAALAAVSCSQKYAPPVGPTTDTLYVHDPCYKFCQAWEMNVNSPCITVTMDNVAGRYLLGFDRTRLDPKPDSLEFVVEAGGKVKFFTTYGKKTDLEWFGPVDLPASGVVKISLKKPYYENGGGKIANPECWKYLSGKCFWLVQTNIK